MAIDEKCNNIQILRFWSAFAVVLAHWEPDPSGEFYSLTSLASGTFGVDIFFVISGFVMAHTVISTQTTPVTFFKRRLWRIAPLYWFLTISVFIVAVVAPNMIKGTSSDPIELLKSLSFIPFMKESGLVRPTLFVGWTLNYEMLFYACFALSLLSRRAIKIFTISFIFIVTIGPLFPSENVLWEFYASPLLLEFAVGLWIRVYVKDMLNLCANIPRRWMVSAVMSALVITGAPHSFDLDGTYGQFF